MNVIIKLIVKYEIRGIKISLENTYVSCSMFTKYLVLHDSNIYIKGCVGFEHFGVKIHKETTQGEIKYRIKKKRILQF